jgi:hypothetical protein
MTVQVIKLPLWRKIRNIDMISFAKPGLTEYLYIVQKIEFANTLCVQYVNLTKDQGHSQETNPSPSET